MTNVGCVTSVINVHPMSILSTAGTQRQRRIILAVLAGILLGAAFPPIPTGITIFVAFIPFFLLLESVTTYGETLRYGYLTLFIWHIIAGYWAGGFTHARDVYLMTGGAALLLLNPFFYLIPLFAFQFIRRYFSLRGAVLAFPFFWVAIELFRAHTELALPWVTLGNTQTYHLPSIQIASFTGVYGVSFWILVINVGLFLVFRKIMIGEIKLFSKKTIGMILTILLFYVCPIIYGYYVLNKKDSLPRYPILKIALIQPNIDPFEKWEGDPYSTFYTQLSMTREVEGKNIDLALWSETAIPFFLLHNNNRYFLEILKNQVDSLQINLLTGVPDIVYYNEDAPSSSKTGKMGERYDTYNSSMLFQPNQDSIQRYYKKLLVPFAERVPYSEELSFLNAMQWNLGLGGWGVGKEKTVFQCNTHEGFNATFSNLICFESIFP
ncbi:MAG: apolipoprotein N-acyltransferase, partial [Bacteroidetes bacterium]